MRKISILISVILILVVMLFSSVSVTADIEKNINCYHTLIHSQYKIGMWDTLRMLICKNDNKAALKRMFRNDH